MQTDVHHVDLQYRKTCLTCLTCGRSHIVKLLGAALAPGSGAGLLIAAPLFRRGSLAEALAGPHAGELLWHRRRCAALAS